MVAVAEVPEDGRPDRRGAARGRRLFLVAAALAVALPLVYASWLGWVFRRAEAGPMPLWMHCTIHAPRLGDPCPALSEVSPDYVMRCEDGTYLASDDVAWRMWHYDAEGRLVGATWRGGGFPPPVFGVPPSTACP